jgi:transposase
MSKILFGLEATGVYSQTLLLTLQQANLAVCLLNPARVKYFGISILRRTKNDRADALLIAEYLLERQPVASRPLRPVEHQLKALVHEREVLSIDLARERNRADKLRILSFKDSPAVLLNQSKERLSQFKTWLGELDLAIKTLIDSDPALRTQARLLCSIPGIAWCSAAKILSQLAAKEFQSAHQLALYAGLNPRQNQSGRFTGKTALSKIGNAWLRKALFMPAAVALRYCAPIKLWAQQIQARRPELTKLQIRGAVMHKLIRIIFGVLKHQSPFDPNLASTFNPA